MNYDTHLDLPTLPGTLSQSGYQTHLVGKLHLHPLRKLYGFDSSDWADGPEQDDTSKTHNDYQTFLLENGVYGPDSAMQCQWPGGPAFPYRRQVPLHKLVRRQVAKIPGTARPDIAVFPKSKLSPTSPAMHTA